jgi:glycerophosphoryl diester phosphodiesterase
VTLVVAHRGSSAAVAEHTLAAYQLAIAEGVDAVECDVRLTSDGHLVCVHDRLLDRTSSGTGPVSVRALADLEDVDFGSWQGTPGARLLTLSDLLALIVDAGRPVGLLIETKHPVRYSGLVERVLLRTLRRYGLSTPTAGVRVTESPVSVMSFSRLALRRVRELAPLLPTVQLADSAGPALLADPAPAIGPGLQVLRRHPELVARAHNRGRQVFVWTVDEPSDLEFVLGLGVDAVISNRPSAVLARLGRPAGRPPSPMDASPR